MTRDFSRAGKAARRKGAEFELEVRDMLRAHGYNRAHRNFQSGGQGGADLADAIPDVHLECKRTETLQLASAWRQACAGARPTDLVLIVHRGSNQPAQATGLLTELYRDGLLCLPFAPKSIGPKSPRPEFLAENRLTTTTRRPMVVHQCVGVAMVTVLFADLLEAWTAAEAELAA